MNQRPETQLKPVDSIVSVEIIRALRGKTPHTLLQLTKAVGLSRPTVLEALKVLEANSWVERVSPSVPKRAGRPGVRFRFRSNSGLVAGVDIGEHKALVVLSDLESNIVGELPIEMPPAIGGRERLDLVVRSIHELRESVPQKQPLLAVGVGLPGLIASDGHLRTGLSGWDGLNLASELREVLHCPVFVENDTHAATLAEFSFGSGSHSDTFIYLLAGHRMAAGLVIDGKLHRGSQGSSGRLFELDLLKWTTRPDTLLASFTSQAELTDGVEISLASPGANEETQRLFSEYQDATAVGLAVLTLTIDPDKIVLGGGISQSPLPFADLVRSRLTHHLQALSPSIDIPPVETSSLGNKAVAMGGVRLAMSYIESDIFRGTVTRKLS